MPNIGGNKFSASGEGEKKKKKLQGLGVAQAAMTVYFNHMTVFVS